METKSVILENGDQSPPAAALTFGEQRQIGWLGVLMEGVFGERGGKIAGLALLQVTAVTRIKCEANARRR